MESDGFRTQSESLRLFVARTTNRHIQQNNAVVLADHPIRRADDYLITMSAKEFHDRWLSKTNTDCRVPLK